MDCSLPGSSVHGIVWARILESVAISFSRGSSRPRNRTQISCITGRWFTNWAMREAQNRYAGTPVYETAGRSTCVIHQQHQSTPALNRFSISMSLPNLGLLPCLFLLSFLSPSCFFNLPHWLLLWFISGCLLYFRVVCIHKGGRVGTLPSSWWWCPEEEGQLLRPFTTLCSSSPFIWAQATQGHCSTKSDRCPRVRKYLLLQSSELALGRVPAHRCRKCWYQNWGCSNIMYVVTTPLSHSLLLDLSALGP